MCRNLCNMPSCSVTTHDPQFFKVPKDGKQMIGGLMKMQKEAWVFVQWDEQMKQKQLGSNGFWLLCGMETCLFCVYLEYRSRRRTPSSVDKSHVVMLMKLLMKLRFLNPGLQIERSCENNWFSGSLRIIGTTWGLPKFPNSIALTKIIIILLMNLREPSLSTVTVFGQDPREPL